MSEPFLTVLVCTRNPPITRLHRVLDGLRVQSLDRKKWALRVIDNGSDQGLAPRLDLSWHEDSEMVVESSPGLTPARLRGIRESRGHLVFVDDDNVLAPDYLERAALHLESASWVGAFGGSIELEFEVRPPEWTRMFHGMLAQRKITRDRWSNAFVANPAIPCGAGMVVRREVAERYFESIEGDSRRQAMDRQGDSMISDGDTDLALTACDLGLGCGQFADLSLTHLIPASRLNVDYLERLAYGMAYSGVIVRLLRTETRKELRRPNCFEQWRGRWQSLWLTTQQRRVRRAWGKGRDEALAAVDPGIANPSDWAKKRKEIPSEIRGPR